MEPILDKLAGGRRGTLGRSEEVIADVLQEPELFGQLFDGLFHPDPVIRSRAADAVEKISGEHPDWLQPHKAVLLDDAADGDLWETRAMVCRMLPRLDLTLEERQRTLEIAEGFLGDKSSIVRTFAMQALADFAGQDPALKADVLPVIEHLTQTGTPAMRARGRKLLKKLKK